MIVYRLASERYTNLDGEGARNQKDNRWNSYGTPIIYTSESPALCCIELHQYISPFILPKNYVLLEVEIPDTKMAVLDEKILEDENWINHKHITQRIGDFFIQSNEYLLLKVPSAWVTNCYNYLINPNHQKFKDVNIKSKIPFPIEGKLFNK